MAIRNDIAPAASVSNVVPFTAGQRPKRSEQVKQSDVVDVAGTEVMFSAGELVRSASAILRASAGCVGENGNLNADHHDIWECVHGARQSLVAAADKLNSFERGDRFWGTAHSWLRTLSAMTDLVRMVEAHLMAGITAPGEGRPIKTTLKVADVRLRQIERSLRKRARSASREHSPKETAAH